MKTENLTKAINIRVDNSIYSLIKLQAEKENRRVSDMIRHMILSYKAKKK